MREDLNNFENLVNKQQIFKETEKAIAIVEHSCDSAIPSKFVWVPKSVAKIEGKYVVAIKGWFADKMIRTCVFPLSTKEAEERLDKYVEKFQRKVS